MTEVLDKTFVKICKSQEALHFFYLSRSFPFLNYLDFIIFYLYFPLSNCYS